MRMPDMDLGMGGMVGVVGGVVRGDLAVLTGDIRLGFGG